MAVAGIRMRPVRVLGLLTVRGAKLEEALACHRIAQGAVIGPCRKTRLKDEGQQEKQTKQPQTAGRLQKARGQRLAGAGAPASCGKSHR